MDFTPASSGRISFTAYFGSRIHTFAWCSFQPPPAELAPIVFVRSDDLYCMDATGNHAVNLTNTAAQYESHPSWSPRADRVAFACGGDIFVMRANGSERLNLTEALGPGVDIWPAWSPDGTRIAWCRRVDNDYEIFVMNADGSGVTQLTNNDADDRCPAWSPDGNKLTFNSDADGDDEIYVMAADGTAVRQLTDNSWRDEEPAFSPDGGLLAFTSWASGNGDIYTVRLDGSGLRQLTHGPGDELGASWSPDGCRLCFEAHHDTLSEIYVINSDGTDQRNISYSSPADFFPHWGSCGSFRVLVGPAGADSGYDPSLGRYCDGVLAAFSPNGLYTTVGIMALGGELTIAPVEGESPLPLVDVCTAGRLRVMEDMGRGVPVRAHIDPVDGELTGNIKRALIAFDPCTGKVATVAAFAGSVTTNQVHGTEKLRAVRHGDTVVVTGEFSRAVTYKEGEAIGLTDVHGSLILDAADGTAY